MSRVTSHRRADKRSATHRGQRHIQGGRGRLRRSLHAASLAAPAPLTPGALRHYSFDLLPPAYVFEAGHRIRLALAGGARAASGLREPQGPGQNPTAYTWTIRSDADHPSLIELPIIGTGWRNLMQAAALP